MSFQSSTPNAYKIYTGSEIDDDLLKTCADFFSNNYGIWGQQGPMPGQRVKMTPIRFRKELMSAPDSTVLAVCYQEDNGQHLGHAFASVWDYDAGRVGWVTQLVVSSAARRQYIATNLLRTVKSHPLLREITAMGLASSHPSSCHVLAKTANCPIESLDTNFCQRNASLILKGSPVDYIRTMELHGSLFEDNCTSGAVSCGFTNFYLDHREPREALATYKAQRQWPLGELLAGHEFLIILPIQEAC